MARQLNTRTLDQAIRDYTGRLYMPTVWSRTRQGRAIDGRDWAIQSMQQFHFKDEFDYVKRGIEHQLGQDALVDFRRDTGPVFTPRRDDVLEEELATRLAMRPDGTYIKGRRGTVAIGQRIVGMRPREITRRNGEKREIMVPVKETVYSGDTAFMASMGAASLTMAASVAILMLDAAVDDLDSGSGAGIIRIVSGSRPADPDAALTGTTLAQLTFNDPAFAGAVDDTDGTVSATRDTGITDDSSADATGTATHVRLSSTNDGSTPLDDKIDGNVGTSGEDLNFNTVSIVSGATVSITAYVMNLSQGSGAS